MSALENTVVVQRFKILEALMEEYGKRMPRDRARLRLAALTREAERRAAALDWFDLRWPE